MSDKPPQTEHYWLIEPGKTGNNWVTPGDTEKDHIDALEYATENLEQLWDSAEIDEPVSVTMTRKVGNLTKMYENEEITWGDD